MFDFKNKLQAARLSTKSFLASTALDERGVAAIEFAFIAPVMLAFYFGMTELSLAVEADRNLSHAASLVGDLAAQDEVMTKTMVEDYIYGALAVLDVSAAEAADVGLELYAFEVETPASGTTARVITQTGFVTFGPAFDGGTAYDPSTIKDEILTDTSGVVVARMRYDYTSPITQKHIGTKTFEEVLTFKPRRSTSVRFDNENGNADVSQSYNMSCSLELDNGETKARCSPN